MHRIAAARTARPFLLALLLACGAALAALPAHAAVLAGWDVSGQTAYGTQGMAPTTMAANVSIGGLTRGGGVVTTGTAAARAWGGTDWVSASAAAAVTAGDYATFSVTANAGFQVSISGLSTLDYRRSATGAGSGVLQYQIGGGSFADAATISYPTTASTGASAGPIDLSGIAALQNVPGGTTITFRIVNYGGTGTGGTWYIFDKAITTASDLEVSGTVAVGTSVVNGACGTANGQSLVSAPTANLCAVGNASAVTGTGPWAWSCSGTGGGTTASCSANVSTAGPFKIFHTNDVHARVTPHKWIINQHGSAPDVFENVGGAAYLAGKMESLVAADPTALVLDGGDISEGNPIGDMNCTVLPGGGVTNCANNGYGNGGMTAAYTILHGKLAAIGGARGARGIDALVVGNHDVRDVSYINNMDAMHAAGVPVISVNVRDIATHQPHFPAYTTVNVNGQKVGILGYTTSTAQVGASLASTLEVVDCQWTGSTVCNISDWVNTLRNTEHCDVVILLTHDGHSDLVDPATPVIADTPAAMVPEVVVSGHWHTWAETAWQPAVLNYKTTFTESSSYMAYIGELRVNGLGGYVGATQHVLRNADITPDPDVAALVANMTAQYNAAPAHAGHPVDEVVGYSTDNLMLDNRMKWWSADEYPWNGNNTAGQWITDGMKWKCDHLAWPSGGGCDLAIEAGGGVRADIQAGPITYLQVYETFPWADDTYVRVSLTGQDILNFIKATNLDTGFSRELDITANDGIITQALMNGQPIGLATTYWVAINNYMQVHPPGGYAWPATAVFEADASATLVRDSLSEFMRTVHPTQGTAYTVGGPRYHFNGEYAGGFRAVVTMMNDADSKPVFEDAFIRMLQATPETVARRGSRQVPTDLVNADGSVNAANRLAEQELYRSFLGFRDGALVPGDIVEVLGKSSFFGGDPEFVDQEGIYGDGQEFRIVGHDASLAKPAYMPSIDAMLTDANKNHYVKFLGRKLAADTVADQNGAVLKIWNKTGFTAAVLPGAVGDTLEITGVPTMESFAYRFRSDAAQVSTATLPARVEATSRVTGLPFDASAPVSLTAVASVAGFGYPLAPVADAEVASGSTVAGTNFGANANLFIQSSSATGTFGVERAWLRFDLSSIPVGSNIASATLQMWNWKSTGAAMPTEVRAAATDTWTEAGINWNNQPVPGAVLDTVTLASGVANTWYSWNVTAFVQGELGGDKTATLVVKPVNEALAGGPSYGFDAKEFGSNAPVLRVLTQPAASSVTGVAYSYRYSVDNVSWTAWTAVAGGAATTAPYTMAFAFPNGLGYYEFYSQATDNLGNVEPAPVAAQAAIHYQAASGAPQSITFGQLPPTPAGSSLTLSATASSGLPVAYTSLTPGICSVSGSQLTTLAVGSCTVTANQGGAVSYWLPASAVTRSFEVTGLPQSINFSAFGPVAVGGSAPLSATASSGLAVTFSSQTATVCTVTGAQVAANTTGTCVVAADQAGDSSWQAAATVTQSALVAGLGQTISFAALPARALGSGTFAVNASASSGLGVVFSSLSTAVCTVSGNSVTLLSAGTCTIVASQPGNATYQPATPVSQAFAVTTGGGSVEPGDGDGPLPLWALALLAALLAAGTLRQQQRVTR